MQNSYLSKFLVALKLDYSPALSLTLPVSSIKLLQMIQNAAAPLILNQPRWTHITPHLYLPPLAYKGLMLTYCTGTVPLLPQHSPWGLVPSYNLWAVNNQCLSSYYLLTEAWGSFPEPSNGLSLTGRIIFYPQSITRLKKMAKDQPHSC